MLKKLLALAGFACVSIATLPVAQAAGMPTGSYQLTCMNARMQGDTLVAACKTLQGSMVPTTLVFSTSCTPGTIANYNGMLVCEKPGGSWMQTCQTQTLTINRTNGVTAAACLTMDQRLITSQVSPSGLYTNCNGQLKAQTAC